MQNLQSGNKSTHASLACVHQLQELLALLRYDARTEVGRGRQRVQAFQNPMQTC